MKIIVTGGTGFIGSHTVVELINSNYEPIIIDNFSNSKEWIVKRIEKITNKKITYYKADCADKNALEEIFKKEKNIEGIIHFAGYKAVGESVENPLKYYDNNLNSSISILKMMKKFNIKNLIFSSSATVYGDVEKNPITEKFPIKEATNPYGHTKIIIEDIIKNTVKSPQILNAISLRYFNPIGAHPSGLIGELPLGIPNNLAPYILKVATNELKQLTIYGDDYNTEDGTCIRDYIHVVDLAKAHISALNHLTKQKDNYIDVFNVGTGKGTSVLEMVKLFEKATNIKIPYTIGQRRAGDIEACFADNTKIVKTLNWAPNYSVEDAFKHSWNWMKNSSND